MQSAGPDGVGGGASVEVPGGPPAQPADGAGQPVEAEHAEQGDEAELRAAGDPRTNDEPDTQSGPNAVAGPDTEDGPDTRKEPNAEDEASGKHRRGSIAAVVRELAIVVIAALVISALVRTFLVQAFWVPSGSMEETLIRNDRILAWKPGGDPGHGDVIVFHDPANWLADPVPETGWREPVQKLLVFLGIMPSASGDDLVKRVIGVGGDTVECCSPEGQIIRNGVPLDEPYIYPGEPTDQVRFKVTVPAGRLFVMGDHRADSADSRFHMEYEQGTVPVGSVVGRAVVIMWPPERWATLPNYQDVVP